MRNKFLQKGQVLIQVVVFSTIAVLLIGALTGWTGTNIEASRQAIYREQAIQLAESGIDYYRWHLAHNSTDFQDGTGHAGPYVHTIQDADGNVAGEFSLTITPPAVGSTIVTIKSTGISSSTPSVSRAILVQMAIPSFAKYAIVSNDNLRFGVGTEVFGPIQSNGGIRFDGLAHNAVTSALSTYTDPDSDACTVNSLAVHTCVSPQDPSPPATPPSRPDVFQAGRQFPVPATDFAGITTDLAQMKANAQASGKYFAASGAQGYQIILKTNNTFDLYKVTSQTSPPRNCTNSLNQTGWGTWSINAKQFVANYTIPADGLVFVEDNVWVEGQINGSRITIAAGRFPDNPATEPSITVNNNLLYTDYTGKDVLSLISQGNINAGMTSASTLRIDGALIAQNGRVGRFYYGSSCSPYSVLSGITLYGMIATNVRYGFAYTDNTGYQTRNLIYDANLLYGPPPSFPLTSDEYQTISWQEVKP